MSSLKKVIRKAKYSKNDNRFLSSRDMAVVKHDQAVRNSQAKRGQLEKKGNEYISVCPCGIEGCFFHGGFDSIPQEEYNKFVENKQKHH